MKSILFLLFIFPLVAFADDIECQAPSQGHLEIRLKEKFHGSLGETELKEWMNHPSNAEVKKNIRDLDRRVKFTPQRLDREALIDEANVKFEQAIQNTGRPTVMDNFPAEGAQSKVTTSNNSLTLEMNNFAKEDLDIFPKSVLDKLEPKVKINYYYPYDKFEYVLTYDGKEQSMGDALLRVQKDMQRDCEVRMIENAEHRIWYERHHGKSSTPFFRPGSGGGGGSGSGRSNQQ